MKLKLACIALLLAIVSCQNKEKKAVPNSENNIKEINGKGYSVQYDSSFRLDESGKNGTEFYLFLPTNPGDDFSANINLIIQNLGVLKYNLNQFISLSEKQIKASGKLVESVRKNENGQEYHVLIFESQMNGLGLKFMQYDYVKDDKAYVLTFSTKKEAFDEHRKAIEKVMDSFKLE